MTLIEAGPGGSLYSFSTVFVGPAAGEPYTLAYVDLDGGPRVLGRVLGTPDLLECDARVRLVAGPPADLWVQFVIDTDEEGNR
jgi:uncharacterized OB-fold protein